jgi:uncharacterized protein YjiS (DUF1127 family)
MDKRSQPIPTNESNSQPASGWMPAVADSAGLLSLAASHGHFGLRAARRHRPIALLGAGSKCRPRSLNRPNHVEPTLATGRHMLTGWVRIIAIWLIQRQGRQDLNSLSDHLLKDIGIAREDIGTSRTDAFWKAAKPF